MEAFFQPSAAAAALMFSLPDTGTIATAKSFSCTISRVLNTCSSEAPRFFAASSPKEVTPSTCSYSRIWKGVFVSVSSATAAVDAPLFLPLVFLAIDTILRKTPCAVGWVCGPAAGYEPGHGRVPRQACADTCLCAYLPAYLPTYLCAEKPHVFRKATKEVASRNTCGFSMVMGLFQ